DRGTLLGAIRPVLANLRQKVRKNVGGTAAVTTVDHYDIRVRQLYARIQFGELSVIPLGDFSQKDLSQHRPGEFQLSGYSGNVVGGNHCSQSRGNMEHLERRVL